MSLCASSSAHMHAGSSNEEANLANEPQLDRPMLFIHEGGSPIPGCNRDATSIVVGHSDWCLMVGWVGGWVWGGNNTICDCACLTEENRLPNVGYLNERFTRSYEDGPNKVLPVRMVSTLPSFSKVACS